MVTTNATTRKSLNSIVNATLSGINNIITGLNTSNNEMQKNPATKEYENRENLFLTAAIIGFFSIAVGLGILGYYLCYNKFPWNNLKNVESNTNEIDNASL